MIAAARPRPGGGAPARRAGFLLAIVCCWLLSSGVASALPSAPDALPQIWGIEVDGPAARELDRRMYDRIAAAGATLVIASGPLAPATADRVSRASARAGVLAFKPLELRRLTSGTPMPAPLGACAESLRARAASRCGVLAHSARDAAVLARSGSADVVMVRASAPRTLARLARSGGATRVVVAVDAEREPGGRVASALRLAARSRVLDVVLRARGKDARRAVDRALRRLRSVRRGDRVPPLPPPSAGVRALDARGATVAWNAPGGEGPGLRYGVYRQGSLIRESARTDAYVAGATCSSTIEVDAVDAAGNRSAKRRVDTTEGPCRPAGGADAAPPAHPPGPPVVAVASRTASTVTLRWAAPSSGGIVGYRLQLDGRHVGTTPDSAYTFVGLACGRDFVYAVQAVDAAGRASDAGAATGRMATEPCPLPAVPDATPPSAPWDVSITARTQTAVTLEWNPATDDVGVVAYRLFRDGARVADVQARTYLHEGLGCGRPYTFGVEAVDAAGNVSQRAEASGSTTPCAPDEPEDPGEHPGGAHAWVDADGGTCARSAAPTAYRDAAACGSLQAAYERARCGDRVLVRGGRYGDQAIKGRRSCERPTVIEAEEPGAVSLGTVVFTDADAVTLRGIKTTTFGADNHFIPTSQRDVRIFSSSDIVVEDSDFGGFNLADTNGGVVLRDNDIGPCDSFDSSNPDAERLPWCTNGKIQASEDITEGVTVERNRIHDFGCDVRDAPNSFTDGIGDDDCHWECLFVSPTKDLTIEANYFTSCDATAMIFMTMFGAQDAGHGWHNVLIENNFLGEGGSTAHGIAQGHCNLWEGTDLDNVVIAHNTFTDSRRLTLDDRGCSGRLAVVGNILVQDPWVSCAQYASWDYNVFASRSAYDCGTEFRYHGPTTANLLAGLDGPRLAGPPGSTPADDYVPQAVPHACPATDIDGDRRPEAANCDAGADDR